MSIKEFYNGCDVFITGGTGFMGKVLIEKLLRSCHGIRNVYVLMRHRKDKCITDRVKDMLALLLFDNIKTEHPGVAENKIIPVFGSFSEIRLGMSNIDYNMMVRNISIVFHVAVTVRFDEPIRDAMIKNVREAREFVGLAAKMKNLLVFLHVSTTYCNCNRIYVEEKVYESPINWQDAILIAENLDPKLSETLTTNSSSDNRLTVYNSSSVKKWITNGQIMQFAVNYFMLHPFDDIFLRPRSLITGLKQLFYYLTIIQQVFPAMLIDFVLMTTEQPQRINLVKLHRKIYIATMALSNFILQTWTFKSTNFSNLLKHTPESEKEDFDFYFDDVNVEDTFITCLTGVQKYLFNTNLNKITQARKNLKKLVCIDRILITLLIYILEFLNIKIFNTIFKVHF